MPAPVGQHPFARNNSAKETARQEPWAWGEPTTSRCRRALELRYRLLPYLYTVAREAVDRGWPILRPLFFHHAADAVAAAVEDQMLVGRDLLVAPVMRPGKVARDVYLPDGRWCDLRTGRWHDGGTAILASAGLDEDLPMFARGGSIIPMGPVMQWSDEVPLDPITYHVFPDARGSAEGTLYEDDGESTAYRDGRSCLTRVMATRSGDATIISATREGSFSPAPRRAVVVVHGPAASMAETDDGAAWELSF